jgi:cytochrome c biogenesis protein CcmG, thiol:disulfide interchange protein DsbE
MSTPSQMEVTASPSKRRIGWVVVPLLVFLALAALFAYALSSGDPSKLPSALIGKPAPDFSFPGMKGLVANGKPMPGVSQADLGGGQVTVVNFWASWCAPCVQEHPYLVALAKRGIRIVGINYKDPSPGGLNFLARHGNPFLRVGTDASGRGAIEWGVYGMPETFVVDGDGRIVFKHVGPIDGRALSERILPAIEKAGRTGGS